MKVNFDITKLATAKDKFIWITIQYILNILDRLKKLPDNNIDNNALLSDVPEINNEAFLLDILKMNINTLNNNLYIYDIDLLNFVDFDQLNYENKFIEFIKHVPVNMCDYDILA